MKVRDRVCIVRAKLGGYTVEDNNDSRLEYSRAACTTLEEALEIASKLMEEEK